MKLFPFWNKYFWLKAVTVLKKALVVDDSDLLAMLSPNNSCSHSTVIAFFHYFHVTEAPFIFQGLDMAEGLHG